MKLTEGIRVLCFMYKCSSPAGYYLIMRSNDNEVTVKPVIFLNSHTTGTQFQILFFSYLLNNEIPLKDLNRQQGRVVIVFGSKQHVSIVDSFLAEKIILRAVLQFMNCFKSVIY
jgi:hypothetical protein